MILCLVMLLALMPVTAFAALPCDYSLYLYEGKGAKDFDGGNWSLNAAYPVDIAALGISYENGSYTFNNVNFDTSSYIGILMMDDSSTLILKGTNTIKCGSYDDAAPRGLDVEGDITVTGDGALTPPAET